jgi:mannosylglycerate hydrolase
VTASLPAGAVDRARANPTVIHLVPHTHWDREWYEPFQVFRMRLVELVDELLDSMEADPRLAFTLDGQVATVDDYLEVRPEGRVRIERLIAEGRLRPGWAATTRVLLRRMTDPGGAARRGASGRVA